ncbi:class I SAM-dependent methyltransferase [Halobaculum sp. CBA1158]|uniref:class I SAM-dependent methyltransferase n=1 Tax=Halobaculum sp. CBA1158 TaxID=2904243 RepID=UPI001F3655B0|nr:class I SAM-dependent methyltransferase [Halobaculum sp. CBA1158]UIO98438.1 class I SAM-dependent methyltransferase [Halobaculum sp. CBA1158]
MKKPIAEHAERFSEAAASYDDEQNSEEYEACAGLVIRRAAPHRTDTVLDLGTGTGAIALALAEDADRVVGRDVSDGMLDRAREKATEQGVDTVEFGYGEFREPNYDGDAQIVTSNFALHHLGDDEKREAIETWAGLDGGGTPSRADPVGPRRIVLGDVMFFGEPDPEEPFYSPEVDDPATVGTLVDYFTAAGYAVTQVDRVHDQVGVITAERVVSGGRES